jgi:hypothetical protein
VQIKDEGHALFVQSLTYGGIQKVVE